MTNDKVQEAAEWLKQLFDDLTKEPAYEKSGEELMLRVQWEIERLDPELQRAVVDALKLLLLSGDSQKTWDALALIRWMHLKEYIPLLEQIRKDLRAKRDTAPKVSLAEVEWALKILKKS
ncbi:MAG TPA: hypothetical protein PLZ21_08485 [Armatimonadota bacterium]|nr:hypothetical protein [Armatimonadota bacterium]